MHRIHIYQRFAQPVTTIFAMLSDHRTFGEIIGAEIWPVKYSDSALSKNAVGSVRRIRMPIGSFEETITAFEPERYIAYRVSRGSPVKQHCGRMVFSSKDGGCAVDYTIEYLPRWPIPGLGILLKPVIAIPIKRGLRRLAQQL